MTINVLFETTNPFNVVFETSQPFNVEYESLGGVAEEYEGETVVTPTDSVQVLNTKSLVVTENIIINPIPHNYGRIEWDGVALTVS